MKINTVRLALPLLCLLFLTLLANAAEVEFLDGRKIEGKLLARDANSLKLEDYWEKDWERVAEDFDEIKALGANVVRIHLQLSKFMDTAEQPNKANLARLSKLIRLAESTRSSASS